MYFKIVKKTCSKKKKKNSNLFTGQRNFLLMTCCLSPFSHLPQTILLCPISRMNCRFPHPCLYCHKVFHFLIAQDIWSNQKPYVHIPFRILITTQKVPISYSSLNAVTMTGITHLYNSCMSLTWKVSPTMQLLTFNRSKRKRVICRASN